MTWISALMSYFRRLGRQLRLAHQRRLCHALDRRAAWAAQARTTPTVIGSARSRQR
jgi:hypothetical protein